MGEPVVLPKTVPLFYFTQLLLLLVLSCVSDPATTKPKHWRLFLVQLNNKQSINLITSLCWSYFSRRNYFRVIHIIPFLQISKLSSQRYRLQRSQQASQCRQTNEPLPLPRVRAQDNSTAATTGQHDTGSSADSDVPCLQYFT
jgi:hypothetical protein